MIKKIILILILISALTSLILAQDSFRIQNNQVIFTIEAPKEGIYGQAYIYENSTKLTTLSLCPEFRCYKKFQKAVNFTNSTFKENIDYTLLYYDYSNYLWKNLSFRVNPQQNQDTNLISGSATQSNKPVARTTISIICGFYTLFDSREYTRCKQEYLSRI